MGSHYPAGFLHQVMRHTVRVCAAAVLCTTSGIAAEYGSAGTSAYRLNVEQPGVFRLNGKVPSAPAPEPAREPPIPSLLADKPFAAQIQIAARDAAIDQALVHAVIHVESRYNPTARSPKGALGLMQVLPDTAARYGITNAAFSPEANLQAGTRYLSDLMTLFDNRLDLVLAAYNAGENSVVRHGQRIPPYPETQSYVPAVLAKYREWREPLPSPEKPVRIEYLPGTRFDPGSGAAAR